MNATTNVIGEAPTPLLQRRFLHIAVVLVVGACIMVGAMTQRPASAFVPSVTAQCATNVIDLSTPAAGQSYTYVAIWRWTGSQWKLHHTEMQRNASGDGFVLDVLRPVNVPSGYVTARVWGWYANSGWILLDTPQFSNGAGPLGTPYCRV